VNSHDQLRIVRVMDESLLRVGDGVGEADACTGESVV